MKKHLLLIDDDIDEFDFITTLLIEMPFLKFTYACNGKSGIDLMLEDTPDVVLLDMNMPAMSGIDCLKKIKHTPNIQSIPVYMYSNCHSQTFVEDAKYYGAVDCYKKPTSADNLRKILVKVLSESHAVNPVRRERSI